MTNPTPHGQVPEALIDLIDAYAETRHRCGGVYNAKTEAARKAVIEALSGVQALSAGPMVTSEQRRLIGVIAEKIEDGTLFQSGIYQKKDLARFVRNMLDVTPTAPAASPTPPAEQPDLTKLTERGAKAWAGVDAQALREGRWYMVTHDGVATLCEDRRDAEEEAKDADMAWPHSGPHRAVQLVEASIAGFTAADMATASAQGFRDGVASLSANAGEPSGHIKEPYTLAEIKAKIASNDYSAEMLLQHAMLLLDSASLSANAGSEQVAEVMFADGKKYIQYTVPKELLPVGAKLYQARERLHAETLNSLRSLQQKDPS